MSKSKANAQSAAERRAAESDLRALVAKIAPSHRRLFEAARRHVQKRLPTAHEMVYEYRDAVVVSYSPSGKGYEGVLAIRANADGIRLCFNRGKELPDPAKLLQGSGTLVRWIAMDSATMLAQTEVANLIEAAMELNAVPFARTGGGLLVICSTTAKRRGIPRAAKTTAARKRKLR